MPTISVKPLSVIKTNYEGAATEAQRRYGEASKNVVWKEPSKKGQANYVAKMMDETVLARREKGIDGVSDEDVRKAMLEKGAPVLASRMKNASQKQIDGYAVIREALDGLTVPDRTGDWEANIDNIQKKVVKAMVDAAAEKYK